MGSYDLVVLGDINMDYVVAHNLQVPLSGVKENGLICWENILELPGGTGLNFSAFAAAAGYSPLMLGKVGSDSAGEAITNWLSARGVGMPRWWRDDGPTGKAIIIRDSAGVRFVVNNIANANHVLSVEDVTDNALALAYCRVLYVSGYCINDPQVPRYEAALHAMAQAGSGAGSATVVFDVVPHRIYERLSFEKFLDCTKHVDILISEVGTMRRFLGLGSPSETVDEAVARETAERLSRFYPRAVLRYGPSGCDFEILIDAARQSLLHHATDHYEVTDKRGFGDRLALVALQSFFDVLPAGRSLAAD